jgi:hypothetical protein
MKYFNYAVLVFVLFLNGCAVTTPFFTTHPTKPILIADIPPNRIVLSSVNSKADKKFIVETLELLLKKPYKPHYYKLPLEVDVSYSAEQKRHTNIQTD